MDATEVMPLAAGHTIALQPLGDRIVVLPDPEPTEQMVNGILKPATTQERPTMGTVVAVGTLAVSSWETAGGAVKAGDRVYYSKYAGVAYQEGETEYLVFHLADIIGVIRQ